MVATTAQLIRRGKAQRVFSLFAVSFAFLMVFAGAAVPIPLYAEYRAAFGITDADISIAMTIYTIGEISMLCFLGTISDAFGRKPMTLLALAFSAAGCVAFILLRGPLTLMLARGLQGISCGLAMSSISAWIVDSSKSNLRLVGTLMAGSGPLIGLTIGSLGIGALCVATPNHQLVYWIMLAAFILAGVLALFVTETVKKRASLRQAAKPILSIDPKLRGVFPIAAACYISTWIVGTYFQSYSSPICVDCFDIRLPIAASLLLAIANAPSVLGAPIETRFRSGLSARVSIGVFLASCAGLLITMKAALFIPFLVFAGLFAASMGMNISAGLRLLLANAHGVSSAKVVSTINLVSYLGCAVSTLATSALVTDFGLFNMLLMLSVVGVGAAVLVFVKTR